MASVDTAKSCTLDTDCANSTSWLPTCNTSANNPDPAGDYNGTAGIFGPNGKCRAVSWSLQCAPSLGAALGGPGATCQSATDCQSGHCINNGSASYCFGGCASDSDCQDGSSCQSGTYLGLTGMHCIP